METIYRLTFDFAFTEGGACFLGATAWTKSLEQMAEWEGELLAAPYIWNISPDNLEV